MNRAARRRANRRGIRLREGNLGESEVRGLLNTWQREAERRARILFEGRKKVGSDQVAPAVWALYRAKIEEARTIQAAHPDMPVVLELTECCRRAIARYMGPGALRISASMTGRGTRTVRP